MFNKMREKIGVLIILTTFIPSATFAAGDEDRPAARYAQAQEQSTGEISMGTKVVIGTAAVSAGALGGAIGAGGGSAIGAAIGTAILPIVGTAVGALIGWGLTYGGIKFYNWYKNKKAVKKEQARIEAMPAHMGLPSGEVARIRQTYGPRAAGLISEYIKRRAASLCTYDEYVSYEKFEQRSQLGSVEALDEDGSLITYPQDADAPHILIKGLKCTKTKQVASSNFTFDGVMGDHLSKIPMQSISQRSMPRVRTYDVSAYDDEDSVQRPRRQFGRTMSGSANPSSGFRSFRRTRSAFRD